MGQLNIEDEQLLKQIAEEKRYSIVRFELRSSKDESLRSTALQNVHLKSEKETMEVVKARGATLQGLEDQGYILIDFRPAIYVAADYEVYSKSELYKQLCELTEESKKKKGFLFDIPHIKKGRVIVTKKGREAINKNKKDKEEK